MVWREAVGRFDPTAPVMHLSRIIVHKIATARA